MTEPVVLVLPGRPATKKNRGIPTQATSKTGERYTRMLPNAEYTAWERGVVARCFYHFRGKLPALAIPLHATIIFWEHPKQRGDVGGYFDALCDALQTAKVVANDRWIRSVQMHVARDANAPRVEVTLEAWGGADAS